MPEASRDIAPIHYPPDPSMGPKMAALTPRRRAFVIAKLETGGENNALCARMAGFQGNANVLRVQGHRLAHSEDVQAAIVEQAARRMKAGVIMATGTLLNIAANPVHKDQLKAAIEIMNRTGLHAITESKVTHEHTINDKAMIQRVVELARAQGLDPKKLLGSYGITIDADFEEVKQLTAVDEDEAGDRADEFDPREGLEDLL